MINLIVFSKDRPMQLQALLDSVDLHAKDVFNNIDVVYKSTEDDYEKGYSVLMGRKPRVNFYKETKFDDNIKSLFKMEYTCFAADDDLVYKSFDNNFLDCFDGGGLVSFSLRLGLNIDHCYSHNKPNKLVPEYYYKDSFIKWNWKEQELDFAYPLSVVSHVFVTEEIQKLTEDIDFHNPNVYEGMLQRKLMYQKPIMASYKESKIFGVPANRVNETHANRNGLTHSYTTKNLNDMYLSDKVIDISKIGNDIHSAQQEIRYEFK